MKNNYNVSMNLEYKERELVREHILPTDVVLELGARYGSVSCTINAKLNNKKNQASVEPDDRVWNALEMNRKLNDCEFGIVKGFISRQKLSLTNRDNKYNGYGSTYVITDNTMIPSFTLEDIEKQYNLKFNVLVADCEGFLEKFFDENPLFCDNLRMIIYEADYPDKCNYKKIKKLLVNKNFINISSGHQNVWVR